jgi:hypothetical protein
MAGLGRVAAKRLREEKRKGQGLEDRVGSFSLRDFYS